MLIAFVNQYIRPCIDTLLIATIIYQGYRLLERTRAIQLIKGVIWLSALFGIAFFFRLDTLLSIVNLFLPSVVIAIALIFQPELRQIVNRLGRRRILHFHKSKVDDADAIVPIITATKQLRELRRGGLIVFMRSIGLHNVITSGVKLDATISSQLLVTIFMQNTPLHDGAVIILGKKIVAAGCILPLSIRDDAVADLGTRHRAGLGIAEESDAIALILSEEKGTLSIAYDGKLKSNLSIKETQQQLQILLTEKQKREWEGHGLATESA